MWGLLRVTRAASDHRRRALPAVALLGVAWVVLRIVGAPVATTSASALAVREVRAVHSGLNAPATLARQIARDRFSATPGDQLLTGLRGKDVLLLMVESYGQVAVQGSSFSPGVDRVLAKGDAQLKSAGFSARSGWLTSPTFGGISWLAHSTFHTGVRIDTQRHYDQLIKTNRLTLSHAFGRAGWRAVDVVPSNNRTWKPGTTFYHYDKIYDSRNLGYKGPRFGYPTMPDQYTLLALQRLELAKRKRRPVFAEVDTLSSHFPWTKIPRSVPWQDVGDGSIFKRIPTAASASQGTLLRHAGQARRAFGLSIEYSLRTVFSFVQRYGNKNTVLIVLGDHQPAHGHQRPGRHPRRADLGHRQGPEGDRPDPRLGLGRRAAAEPASTGLADAVVPRPLPHRVRLDAVEPLNCRRRSVVPVARRERVAQQHHVADLADLGERRAPSRVPREAPVAHEARGARVADEERRDDQLQLVDEVVGRGTGCARRRRPRP